MMLLCTPMDLSTGYCQPLPELEEEQAKRLVVDLLVFFRTFLDARPWAEIGFLSRRAENVLRRERAITIADVRRCLLKAHSSTGLQGAGALVQREWVRLLRDADGRNDISIG